MLGRVVEISTNNRHLSKDRGFLLISSNGDELGKIPLDDILGIVVTGHGCTHSSNLITSCSKYGISFVICGSNFSPSVYMMPVDGHTYQSERFRMQISMKVTTRNKLWQQIIKSKIKNQAWVLDTIGKQYKGANILKEYSKNVKSGDSSNFEGVAAACYWRLLMGDDFRRDRQIPGVNSMLNYGYTILRSTVARAVCGSGLHPTIGLHHIGRSNSMCLVDDLMEPFRPIIDITVYNLIKYGYKTVSDETKHVLCNLTSLDMSSEKGVSPLFTVCSVYVKNLVNIISGKTTKLLSPSMPTELTLNSLYNSILNK